MNEEECCVLECEFVMRAGRLALPEAEGPDVGHSCDPGVRIALALF